MIRSRVLRPALLVAVTLVLVGPAMHASNVGTGQTVQAATSAPFATHGSRSVKSIALTIDDCDSQAAVTALTKILQTARVNATFFCTGKNVAASPAFWRTWAEAGFPMGNHTYNHTSLTSMSYTAIVADIKRANVAVPKIIGRPLLPVLRPMGGNYNYTVLRAAAAAGQKLVLNWDVSVADTSAVYGGGTDPVRLQKYINDLIKNGQRGTSGSVILMHANGKYTQQALPAIIAYYKANRYQFVTVGQMFNLGGNVPYPLRGEIIATR